MNPATRLCAVYTRKSSEEGLDQEFNSLNAQREACLAYISSQKSEGWRAVPDEYDDGGFSGGSMERPGLKRLIENIKAGKVHIVVVYKIDRLTRSLMDFAKLVETFDAHGVTFVSVTQSFNTTTSMGRLTLNVLLSFAQFEREITAERIRDKFAASKKKGIWMGGNLPTGYGVANRQLYVKPDEARFVNMIFEEYLKRGSVHRLRKYLHERNIRSPVREKVSGVSVGGYLMSTGAIRHMLKNPVYIGKIKHRSAVYDGQHPAIVSSELWQKVSEKIESQRHEERFARRAVDEPQILLGKVYDVEGNKYTPVFTTKRGRRYRYYVSRALLKYGKTPKGILYRIPSLELEEFVHKTTRQALADPRKLAEVLGADYEEHSSTLSHISDNPLLQENTYRFIKKVIVDIKEIRIEVQVAELCKYIEDAIKIEVLSISHIGEFSFTAPFQARRVKRGSVVILPAKDTQGKKDLFDMPPSDLRNLVRGIVWRDEHFRGKTIRQIAEREKLSEGFVGRLIHYSVEFC